jgi:hypothetical protein
LENSAAVDGLVYHLVGFSEIKLECRHFIPVITLRHRGPGGQREVAALSAFVHSKARVKPRN